MGRKRSTGLARRIVDQPRSQETTAGHSRCTLSVGFDRKYGSSNIDRIRVALTRKANVIKQLDGFAAPAHSKETTL